ncbi:T9SS type B sorting domain-containing protein [Spirosoma agri]|uniref:Gliding motility-associated C-terminal domain-containing protein n=1 Tax=Spirosoma agri TaxID=1987381 RepID=A0A6M0IR53_9BACT|nr:gliding motility-associated C-terminal domain-containing protein [Spirosoma agri]NEU70778.1 gliding motility-associated C-terminal domain-containing protein [Spirosoma agri]
MKRAIYFFFLFGTTSAPIIAQQLDCTTIGFERGTTDGWTLTNGQVTNQGQQVVFQNETAGTFENGHRITSLGDGNDPKITAEAIPMVAPGSTHSIRIGNVTRGSRFDRIKGSFVVTADNTLFQYKLAVILQNANHEAYEKPGFTIRITDSEGQELPCSFYDIQVSAAGTVDGFKTQGDIQYRNWTVGAIDLRNYIGRRITVEVTAHGCTHNGHVGYAYFDAQCLKSEINQASACPDADGYVVLNAPDGFDKYSWNMGQTTRSIRVKAAVGQTYWVKLSPFSSLSASCEFQLDHQLTFQPVETTLTKTICEGDGVVVGDTTYRSSGQFVRTITHNMLCDSTVKLSLTVKPLGRLVQRVTICEDGSLTVGDSTYRRQGTYVNHFTNSIGCDSVVTTHLTVNQLATRISPDVMITQGDSAQLIVTATPTGAYTYRWNSTERLSCPTCAQTWATPSTTTQYVVQVSDEGGICRQTKAVTVTVVPCGLQLPTAFTPNADQMNDHWIIKGNACVRQLRNVTIYNRWGEVLYHQENMALSDHNRCWDGQYQGQPVLEGLYPYTIQAELTNGDLTDYRGVVQLVR